MSYKEKALSQLRKGYTPIETGPDEKLNSIFKSAFKQLVDRKELGFFFELFDSNETLLRAWAFLGIHSILNEKPIGDNKKIVRLQNIIIELLRDDRKIEYFKGSLDTQTSLRAHHLTRICELDESIIFEPIFEYVSSTKEATDEVVGNLLEIILSKVSDSRIEPLILQHAQNVSQQDFSVQFHIIKAFENAGLISQLKEKDSITEIFKNYLKYIENDKSELKETNERIKLDIIVKKKNLKETIYKVAAELELDFEKETLAFLSALSTPYNGLKQIAERFKNNENFKSLLLKKLKESDNPNFIKDILTGIIILREIIPNWKDLAIEYLNKFEFIDVDLIVEMQEANLLDETMLVKFLNEGEDWQLEFIRGFLLNNPEIFNNWSKFRSEFINTLKFIKKSDEKWDNYPRFKEKKEMALKILIDLEKTEMIEYCVDNFIHLDDTELRKIALFAIINFGAEDLWLKLKNILKDNKEAAEFFKKFMRNMERKEWKLYY